MSKLHINDNLSIPLADLQLSAIRSSGPGGQHVNKVSSAIQLRYNLPAADLPEEIRQKLLSRLDGKLSKNGDIVLTMQTSRSQEQNRQLAIEALQRILRGALIEKAPRKRTRPKKSAVEDRIKRKKMRGQLKSTRQKIDY